MDKLYVCVGSLTVIDIVLDSALLFTALKVWTPTDNPVNVFSYAPLLSVDKVSTNDTPSYKSTDWPLKAPLSFNNTPLIVTDSDVNILCLSLTILKL